MQRKANGVSKAVAERRRSKLLSIDLEELYDEMNQRHWKGRLPRVKIEWSSRLRVAGQCSSPKGPIRIGLRYHVHFPRDLRGTLKHEMVHLIHFNHDDAFEREVRRVRGLLHARPYPGMRWPYRYVYECPTCGRLYRSRKRVALACASCGAGEYSSRHRFRLVATLQTRG